jgi:regulator of protease activity HflC (stomatin/prohibitin superfamily)
VDRRRLLGAEHFFGACDIMNNGWILLLLIVLVVGLLLSTRFARTIVYEYERGLKFTRGRFKGVVGPGQYWHYSAFTHIQKLDVRPSRVAVAGQEVLTADGVPVKASIVATVQVKDAERAVLSSDSYLVAIHTELQLALRAIVSGLPIDDLLRRRAEVPAQLKTIAGPRLEAIGVELQDASLRDLTCPGELKKIFTQVVRARQEGLAALEKARGETAALRNLANAAALIERSPSLMQLRALQVLGQQPGNTLVLGMQQGAPIVPLRAQSTSANELARPTDVPPEVE